MTGSSEPAFATFRLRDGRYELDIHCPACGAAPEWWCCYPGEWPQCGQCRAKVLRYGRTPAADCVTPNGRVDCHLKRVRARKNRRGVLDPDTLVCAFCGKL